MIDPRTASGEPVSAAERNSPVTVADPRVQAALERIADSAGIDLESMPEVLEDVYRRLNSALADDSSGHDTSMPGASTGDVGQH